MNPMDAFSNPEKRHPASCLHAAVAKALDGVSRQLNCGLAAAQNEPTVRTCAHHGVPKRTESPADLARTKPRPLAERRAGDARPTPQVVGRPIPPPRTAAVQNEPNARTKMHHGVPARTVSQTAGKPRPGSGLHPRQLTAAQLLVSGMRIGEVAARVGVERHAIWRWGKDPEFQAEVRRAANDVASRRPAG